jgi:hypothetical protein
LATLIVFRGKPLVLAPEELVRRQQQNDEPKKKPKTAQQQQQRRAKETPELPTSTAPKRLKSVEQKMTCLARMVLEQSKLRRTRKSDGEDAKGEDNVKEEDDVKETTREPRESYIFSVLTSELTPHLVQQYTCEQVHALIESVPGCGQIAQVFREQLIDGDAFLLITKKDIPTHIPTGAKVKLLYLINIINSSSR